MKSETHDATHLRHMSRLITVCPRQESNLRPTDYEEGAGA